MSLPQTITTQELIALTGYSAPALVDLERAGVVGRQEKDTWLIGTVGKIVAHLRERTRRSKSAAEERLADAKARALELRVQREAGALVPTAAVENYTKMVLRPHSRRSTAVCRHGTRAMSRSASGWKIC